MKDETVRCEPSARAFLHLAQGDHEEMTAVEEVVAAAQQGDDEAFGRLVERYQDIAYYTAYRYLGHPQLAVRSLPPLYRQVTVLFYLQGLSYAEIVERLDLPLSTVKKRLYTARQHLKEAIGPMTETVDRPSRDDTFGNRVRFFVALKKDDVLQVRQLVRRQPELIHAKTEWGVASDGWYWPLGNTALHWAAGTGNEALAELLVEHGADVDVPDDMGKTPLVRAVHMGQAEMVRWLLQHGANPAGRTAPEQEGPTGLTPLHSDGAAAMGRP